MAPEAASAGTSRFAERPTTVVVPDAWRLGAVPAGLGVLCALLGFGAGAWIGLGLAGFVVFFFRNPQRALPGDALDVVAPADGRVIEVSEDEDETGRKGLRIGIFLSIFDVHVNRAPLAGRVLSIERSGGGFLPAFNPAAVRENVRCTLTLETERGERVRVVQITGLVARRIVCHPEVGEWLERGARYGLIRFGSRTDVLLPAGSEALVTRGARVRGGATRVARLPEDRP